MRVWRIAHVRHAVFDGEGARLYGSRWTRKGIPAVFASATLSLAALERFVHTDSDIEGIDLAAIGMDIDASVGIDHMGVDDLPRDWRVYPAPYALTAVGDRWLRAGRAAVLSIPSVVIPHERNFIINPLHRSVARLVPQVVERFSFDPRMWKKP